MPVPATTGQLRTRLEDMEIGDYIPALYQVTGNSISRVGDTPTGEMEYTGINGGENWFYFVKVARGLLVADRVCHHSVTWNTLNTAKVIQGLPWDNGNIIPVMTSNTSPNGVASANSEYTTFLAWKAFNKTNNDLNDCWATQATSGYLQYQFSDSKVIKGYELTPQYGSNNKNGAPKKWVLEGSNDGVIWETLDKRSGETSWVYSGEVPQSKRYTFSNNKAFTHYRISISENNNHTFTAISEFELFEDAGIIRSLTGGVAFNSGNGNKATVDAGQGAWPTNNEWDKYIANFPIEKVQSGKTLEDVFHGTDIATWTQDTLAVGIVLSGITASGSTRLVRKLGIMGQLSSTASGIGTGFRPVLEYKE